MQISVTEAKAMLTELVRRAEAGEEVVLTRHGHPTVRLMPVVVAVDVAKRRALMDEVRAAVAADRRADPGIDAAPRAARSQDFLYDEFGLPA